MRSRPMLCLVVGSMLLAACQSAGSPSITSPTVATPSASPTATATATSSPSAEPTVPTAWTTYTSTRYAYAIDAPADWTSTPAKRDWPADGETYPDDNAIDKWAIPPSNPNWVLMFVLSVAMAPGETPADRMAKLDADNAQYCHLANRKDVTVAARRRGARMASASEATTSTRWRWCTTVASTSSISSRPRRSARRRRPRSSTSWARSGFSEPAASQGFMMAASC